jgi:hypothetical protein
MTKIMAVAFVVATTAAAPLAAQADLPDAPHYYLEGSVFGQSLGIHQTIGGAATVGQYVSSRVSLNFEVTATAREVAYAGSDQERSSRAMSVALLAGFRKGSLGRLQTILVGGMAFGWEQKTPARVTTPEEWQRQYYAASSRSVWPSAVIGLDMPVSLGRGLAIVPQLRGYVTVGIPVYRPSIAVRWNFGTFPPRE